MKEVAKSEALTIVLKKIQVFWNGKQRRLVHSYRRFEECFSYIYILNAKPSNGLPEGAMVLRNVCQFCQLTRYNIPKYLSFRMKRYFQLCR